MLGKEPLNVFSLVSLKVVEHNMNFLGPPSTLNQAIEKGDELLGSVPRRCHAMHLPGLDIESSVQRKVPWR